MSDSTRKAELPGVVKVSPTGNGNLHGEAGDGVADDKLKFNSKLERELDGEDQVPDLEAKLALLVA